MRMNSLLKRSFAGNSTRFSFLTVSLYGIYVYEPCRLRVYSRVIIAMSVIFRLTQSTVHEAWMTHCFLKISHKSCENKPNELGDYRQTVTRP